MKVLAYTLFLSLTVFTAIWVSQSKEEASQPYLDQALPGLDPQKFAPGLISLDNQYEFGSIFSANGKEFFYAIEQEGGAEIMYSKETENGWTEPVVLVAEENFGFNDPMLSPDQEKLYFISNKAPKGGTQGKDYDIWYIQREENGWSKPIQLGAPVNSSADEYYMSFSSNGDIYFSSNLVEGSEERKDFDIYKAKKEGNGFGKRIAMPMEVNSRQYEADVFVAGDESYLIFCSSRNGGMGRGDLYISFKTAEGGWTKAKNMGSPINDAGHQLCPFVTADGKYFFYTSNQDIYWVDAKILEKYR